MLTYVFCIRRKLLDHVQKDQRQRPESYPHPRHKGSRVRRIRQSSVDVWIAFCRFVRCRRCVLLVSNLTFKSVVFLFRIRSNLKSASIYMCCTRKFCLCSGSPSCFLFSLKPHIEIYPSTGLNSNFMYFNHGQETLPNGLVKTNSCTSR